MRQDRDDRPDFEKLLDWVEGRLGDEEAARLELWEREAHAEALAELAWIRSFTLASKEVTLQTPPAGLRADLESRFDGYAESRRQTGIVKRIVAALSFDSGLQSSFGVRSVSSPSGETQRQVSYETDVADISISIQPTSGAFDLLGQLLLTGDEDPESFTVQLTKDDEEVAITGADDFGEFTFEGVPEGTFEVILTNGEVEISIPPFDLTS